MESSASPDTPDVPTMSGPATYVIRVRGRLGANDIERLAGVSVETVEEEAGVPITTLRGRLADQAALLGVLNALYAWQMPVLSVAEAEPRDMD